MNENDNSFEWHSSNEHAATGRRIARYYSDKIKRKLTSDAKTADLVLHLTNDMRQLAHVIASLGIPMEPVDFEDPSLQLGTKFIVVANRYVDAVERYIPIENEPGLPPEEKSSE